MLLKWLFDNGIANGKFAASEDKAADPPTPLQRVLSPSTNRLLHPRAGIARTFDEGVHLPDAKPLPDQVV
jgi:hypothetical protein